MPVRIPKRVWAKHRALIELLYQSNPLLEVIRIMAEEHGFEAEKRQYVYRLEQWGVRKYNVNKPPGENSPQENAKYEEDDDDDDEDAEMDNNDLAPPAVHLNNQPSPFSDGQSSASRGEYRIGTPSRIVQDSQAWYEGQRERLDLMLSVPNNAVASEKCLSLWHTLPGDIRAGALGQYVLSACIRLGVGYPAIDLHQALSEIQPRASSFADRLRLSLLLHFLQLPGAPTTATMCSNFDRFLKQPEPRLDLVLLITRFASQHLAHHEQPGTGGPSRHPRTVRRRDEILHACVSKLAKHGEATKILRGLIEWCQVIYATTGDTSYLDMPSHCLTQEQTRQLSIAEVTCYLAKRLLCEPNDMLPSWPQASESRLGISRITCAATITRMASNYCQRQLGYTTFTAHQQVDCGATELLQADPRTLWSMFLDALLEAEAPSMAPFSHTFDHSSTSRYGQGGPLSPMDNYTFFNNLNMGVQSFVCNHLAPESCEVDLERLSPSCPELDGTGAASHQGSHSPVTPMQYPVYSHSPGVGFDDANDMASFSHIAQDVDLGGMYDQDYCDVDLTALDPGDTNLLDPSHYAG